MKGPRAKSAEPVEMPVFTIRGQRVILDADLAKIYGVPTKRLNEAVSRNRDRFPDDFAFQLGRQEVMNLRSQFATSSFQPIGKEQDKKNSSQSVMSSSQQLVSQIVTCNWSQFATSSSQHRGATYRLWAFTEHGALMAANILRSPRAVQMSVYVVRAFVKQREQLVANAAILKRLAEIDKTLLEHDDVLRTIWTQLQPLLAPPPDSPKTRIGFLSE